MYILILDQWGNKVDYRPIENEELVKEFAKINNFTTKICEIKPEIFTNNRQLLKYEEDMKKTMKKVEASKADKKADKAAGYKEGSAKDVAQDKKLMAKMKKK